MQAFGILLRKKPFENFISSSSIQQKPKPFSWRQHCGPCWANDFEMNALSLQNEAGYVKRPRSHLGDRFARRDEQEAFPSSRVQGQRNNRDGRQREAHDRAGTDAGRDQFMQKSQRSSGGQQQVQGQWVRGQEDQWRNRATHQPWRNRDAPSSYRSQSDKQYHQPHQQQHDDEAYHSTLVVLSGFVMHDSAYCQVL